MIGLALIMIGSSLLSYGAYKTVEYDEPEEQQVLAPVTEITTFTGGYNDG